MIVFTVGVSYVFRIFRRTQVCLTLWDVFSWIIAFNCWAGLSDKRHCVFLEERVPIQMHLNNTGRNTTNVNGFQCRRSKLHL